MDYFQILKEIKDSISLLEFEEKIIDVRRLVSQGVKQFLAKGVSTIFKDIDTKYPLALESIVENISPYVERIYYLQTQNTIIYENNDSKETNIFKISENTTILKDVIRAFVNGSKSYYIITKQEKLLHDLINETVHEIDLIIVEKVTEVFNRKDREFVSCLEVINQVKGNRNV